MNPDDSIQAARGIQCACPTDPDFHVVVHTSKCLEKQIIGEFLGADAKGVHEMTTKNHRHEHELMRRKLWCNAWTATSNSNDCKDSSVATRFANAALEEFDLKFQALENDDDAIKK